MTAHQSDDEPRDPRLGREVEAPGHPKLAAALLMTGIVVFIILISLVPLL